MYFSYFIRFTDHYFINQEELTHSQGWFEQMAYILANYNKVPGDIINSDRERNYIIQTIKSIYQEYQMGDAYSNAIIAGAMASILNILARSIERQYVSNANELDSRFGELLRFINTHLTEAETLRIPTLASQFGIAPSYLSEYFKKHAGLSLADYIIKSKLKLVQTKVLHTDLTLKELAYQLNFTDSSHLAKSFKKAFGITISEFKKAGHRSCLA